MDIYLYNTIANTLWYIFTVVFILYKFTSFFSYVYGFAKFCFRLSSGISYVCREVTQWMSGRKRHDYASIPSSDPESQSPRPPPPAFFDAFKTRVRSLWGGRRQIPQHSTERSSYMHNSFFKQPTVGVPDVFDDAEEREMAPLMLPKDAYFDSNVFDSTDGRTMHSAVFDSQDAPSSVSRSLQRFPTFDSEALMNSAFINKHLSSTLQPQSIPERPPFAYSNNPYI